MCFIVQAIFKKQFSIGMYNTLHARGVYMDYN